MNMSGLFQSLPTPKWNVRKKLAALFLKLKKKSSKNRLTSFSTLENFLK